MLRLASLDIYPCKTSIKFPVKNQYFIYFLPYSNVALMLSRLPTHLWNTLIWFFITITHHYHKFWKIYILTLYSLRLDVTFITLTILNCFVYCISTTAGCKQSWLYNKVYLDNLPSFTIRDESSIFARGDNIWQIYKVVAEGDFIWLSGFCNVF